MFSRYLLVACLGALAFSSWADSVNLTSIDAATSASWVQLFENRSLTRSDAQALSLSGIRGVLEALAPQIKAQPGYTGVFIANCSLYVNTILERVSCNITSPEAAIVSVAPLWTNQTRLPWDYAYEITRSHIVLVNVWADWSGRLTLYDEDYAIAAYPRTETCSASITNTATNPSPTQARSASLTQSHSRNQTLSPSRSPSLSPSKSVTGSVSTTRTLEPTLTRTESGDESMSNTDSRSQTRSASSSPEPSRSSTKSNSRTQTLSVSSMHSESSTDTPTFYIPSCVTTAVVAVVVNACCSVPNPVGNPRNVAALIWQIEVNTNFYTYSEAENYCSSLGTGWRLPNIWELQTLYYQRGVLNGNYEPVFYWSSTLISANAWLIHFGSSFVEQGSQGGLTNLRCAR